MGTGAHQMYPNLRLSLLQKLVASEFELLLYCQCASHHSHGSMAWQCRDSVAPVGEIGSFNQRVVRYAHTVVQLIALPQPTQDAHCLRNRWLVHEHLHGECSLDTPRARVFTCSPIHGCPGSSTCKDMRHHTQPRWHGQTRRKHAKWDELCLEVLHGQVWPDLSCAKSRR